MVWGLGGLLWRPGLPEYKSTLGTLGGQVARELPPFPKRGWVPRARARALAQSARAFPVLPQLVLLPFAASRVSWAAGPALGPTQSDEAACQHLVEGGLGSPFLVPSPVSSRTYRICCTIFLLPCPYRIVSCLLEREHPQHCPAGRSALDVKVAIPLQHSQSRRGMRNHREAQRATSQVHRRHHQRHNQTTPFLPLQDTRGSWQVGRGV